MPVIPDELNSLVNYEVTRLIWLSAHTGDPGLTGDNEPTDPSYSRQQITWAPAVNGIAAGSQESFSVPPASYTHMGFWDSPTGGTFRGADPLDSVSTLNDAGTLRITPNFSIEPADA